MDNNNKEQALKRRKSDTFLGQLRSSITANLLFAVLAAALAFLAGYKGMEFKVAALERVDIQQDKEREQIKNDNVALKELLVGVRIQLQNLADKQLEMKSDLNDRIRELREDIRKR